MIKIMTFIAFAFISTSSFAANLSGKTLNDFFVISSEMFNKAVIVDPAIDSKIKVYQVHYSGDFNRVFALVLEAHDLAADYHSDVIRVKPKSQSLSGFFPFLDNVTDAYITSTRLSKVLTDFQSVDVDFKVVASGDTFYISDRALTAFDVKVTFIDSCLVRLTRFEVHKFITCPPVINQDFIDTDNDATLAIPDEVTL